MINIRYFGALRELAPAGTEQIEWQGASSDDLLTHLRDRGEPWTSALAPERVFKVALNQTLLHAPAMIPDGAQVAILPPVTGG